MLNIMLKWSNKCTQKCQQNQKYASFFDSDCQLLRLCFFCGPFLLFVFRVCLVFFSVHCSLVVTCWETGPMALLCAMFYCVFVTFPCGVLDQVCGLIVSIPDIYKDISINVFYIKWI